jgi:hypothetical protein
MVTPQGVLVVVGGANWLRFVERGDRVRSLARRRPDAQVPADIGEQVSSSTRWCRRSAAYPSNQRDRARRGAGRPAGGRRYRPPTGHRRAWAARALLHSDVGARWDDGLGRLPLPCHPLVVGLPRSEGPDAPRETTDHPGPTRGRRSRPFGRCSSTARACHGRRRCPPSRPVVSRLVEQQDRSNRGARRSRSDRCAPPAAAPIRRPDDLYQDTRGRRRRAPAATTATPRLTSTLR